MTRPKYRFARARELSQDRRCRVPECPLATEQLRELSPFKSAIRRGADGNCRGCGDLIEVGDTVWNPTQPIRIHCGWLAPEPGDENVLCHRCGVGWEMHEGRLSYADARGMSPFANAHLDTLGDR